MVRVIACLVLREIIILVLMLVVQRVINGQSARVDEAMARVANLSAGAEDSMWCVK